MNLLNLVLLLPLVGFLLILLLPKSSARMAALIFSVVIFAASLGLTGPFFATGNGNWFATDVPWIRSPEIRYHVAVDGLSLWLVILSTLMIPIHVTLIPLYIVTRQLGLIDNIAAVILPGTAQVFGIFLMRQYIQTLPSELEDAARIDGASEWEVFLNVILPLCRPAMAALAIFTFVRNWNDFLWPLIALNRPQNYTLTVGVANLQAEFMTDWGIIFAGAALAALPMIAFFLAFQKYFLEGVRMGALKG